MTKAAPIKGVYTQWCVRCAAKKKVHPWEFCVHAIHTRENFFIWTHRRPLSTCTERDIRKTSATIQISYISYISYISDTQYFIPWNISHFTYQYDISFQFSIPAILSAKIFSWCLNMSIEDDMNDSSILRLSWMRFRASIGCINAPYTLSAVWSSRWEVCLNKNPKGKIKTKKVSSIRYQLLKFSPTNYYITR